MKNNAPNTKSCKCRTKSKCILNDQCQHQDIIYKCTISTSVDPDKVYLGTAGGDLQKGPRIFQHDKKVSFMSPRKAGNC